jgi:conjugal transfer pilus assembly protein TraB
VAAAQGSLADQRALFRLTTLNIRLPDGRKKIVPCDGWIVGEDGIRGMEGILLDPIGKAIAGTAQAGFISGIGEGFAQSQTTTTQGFYNGTGTTTISGDPLIYAAGKGASGAANALSGIIKDRIKLLVPHVKVFSGREATAVFSKAVNITDLFESLDNGDSSFSNSVD